MMNGNDGIRTAGRGGRRRSWATGALLVLGAWEVTEPTHATIVRAQWNSILAGLLTLALAGWALRAARRRARQAPGGEHPPHAGAADARR